MGTGFPPPGTSYGRANQYVMGTSPYGKSVDMVDVCTKLMEGELLQTPRNSVATTLLSSPVAVL